LSLRILLVDSKDRKVRDTHHQAIQRAEPELRKLGVEVKQVAKPSGQGMPVVDLRTAADGVGRPYVALDAWDAANVTRPSVVADPLCRSYWKFCASKDRSVYAAKGREHCYRVRGSKPRLRGEEVREEDAGKVVAAPVYFSIQKMRSVLAAPAPNPQRKDIAVFFAGTVVYGDPGVTAHRSGLHAALLRLMSTDKSGLRWVIEKRSMRFPAYVDAISKALIAVSPWGYGELCWRDVEAAAAGCIVVKPDSRHLCAPGDLFELPCFRHVSPTWDGLEEAISYLLERIPRIQRDGAESAAEIRKRGSPSEVAEWYRRETAKFADMEA
jgi:hypothetical protein